MKMGWTSAMGPVARAPACDDHADPGQPDLAVQQVGDQPQPERA